MCEVVLIILMCRQITEQVERKGLGGIAILFVGAFVLSWIGGEIAGFALGYLITGTLVFAYAGSLAGAVLGGIVGYMAVIVWPSYDDPSRWDSRGLTANRRRRRSSSVSGSSVMVLLITLGAGFAFFVLAAVVILGAWFLRRHMAQAAPFQPEPEPLVVMQPPPPPNNFVNPPPPVVMPPVKQPAKGMPQMNADAAIEAMRNGQFLKPAPGDGPTTFLRFASSPGDRIGLGRNTYYSNPQMVVTSQERGAVVHIDVKGWSIHFGAPGRQPLRVGEYRDARRHAFRGDSPGLEFSGMGRGSNEVSGEFTVWQLETDGVRVTRLAVDFVQRSENTGPPLYGVLRYNSTLR